MERLKSLAKGSWSLRLGGLILCSGLALIFISLTLHPVLRAQALQISPTATLKSSPSSAITESPTSTPEPDIEAQIGANAGLVCGAVSLVIIIIAGLVRSARWIQERGNAAKGEEE
jgi:hypothetical protein